ncbi:hypothetical protein FPOAC2_10105 [Fusarium poae]
MLSLLRSDNSDVRTLPIIESPAVIGINKHVCCSNSPSIFFHHVSLPTFLSTVRNSIPYSRSNPIHIEPIATLVTMKFSTYALLAFAISAQAQRSELSSIRDEVSSAVGEASSAVDSARGSVTSAIESKTKEAASAASSITSNIDNIKSSLSTARGAASTSLRSALESASTALESAKASATETSTSKGAGSMPTAAIAMGAMMGGAAIFVHM